MKKAKIKCPYFVLLVVTSVLFTCFYQMKEQGLFADLFPFAWENDGGKESSPEKTKENTENGNAAHGGIQGEAISEEGLPQQDAVSPSQGENLQGDASQGENLQGGTLQGNNMQEDNMQEDGSQENNPQENNQQDGSAQGGAEQGGSVSGSNAAKSPEEYLSDTLFIGDSRTSSLMEYAGWDTAHFYVKYGLTIWDVLEAEIVDYGGSKISVEEALQKVKFGKIYIMLGINELGRGTPETFAEQYEKVIVRLKQLQPDAVIVVEAIMHVTAEKDAEETYINNAEINARNEKLKEMAEKEKVCWLDVNTVTDEEESGCLVSAYSFDGVHLKVKYLDIWKNFILENPF